MREIQVRSRSSIMPEYFGLGDDLQRMRRPNKFSRRGLITGMSCALKLRGSRQHGSLLERDLHTLLEADPTIESFALEAHSLTYFAPNEEGRVQRHTYTPDVVARTTSGEIVVFEAKAAALRNKPDWRHKEQLIRDAYWHDHGVRLHVLTEWYVRAEPRLSNCKIIVSRARGTVDAELEIRLIDALSIRPRTLSELYGLLPAPSLSIFAAGMALIYRGRAQCDLARPIGSATILSEVVVR